ETLFKNSENYEAKSAGTSPSAVRPVSQEIVDWADIIFAMSEKEDGHVTFLKNNFNLSDKPIYDLDISDVYDRNDPKLVSILKKKIANYIQ
ncbi:MAG: phosphotyrosine protein phosphatase, partial [bacterium]|nr:phosphotyrosine protein phosphatase [bacterium]